SVVAGDPASTHLRPVGHEPAKQVDVLPVDVLDTLGDEDARLLLRPAGVVLVLRTRLGGHQKGSSEGSKLAGASLATLRLPPPPPPPPLHPPPSPPSRRS